MKSIFYLLALSAIFVSCGSSDPVEENVKLDTFEQKLSYVVGLQEAKKMTSDPNFDSYNKELVIAGFKENFSNIEPMDCRETFKNLFGENNGDFNLKFVDEGSRCVGRILAYRSYIDFESVGKISVLDTFNLFKGFEHQIVGDSILMADSDQQSIIKEFNDGMQAVLDKKMEETWGANRIKGEAFLEENAKRSEITVTSSGLQYEVLKKGSGSSPGPMDEVTVHYTGYHLDGTKFESSLDGGKPISFQVGGVIPGWTEALQLMSKGSKFKVYIPQELGYSGNPSPGGPIEPYEALVFEIELISF